MTWMWLKEQHPGWVMLLIEDEEGGLYGIRFDGSPLLARQRLQGLLDDAKNPRLSGLWRRLD